MENRGLLFIPDISGFTRFINETEIEHSRLIIQELLGILIDANDSGLSVSEIEGDAILFYRFGEPPQLTEVYKQVNKMFCEFHKGIFSYDHRRYCYCTACNSVSDLTLKVITHYGEFTGYTVQNFNKLIGKDIIVAHQLLKNDIDQHEYWLVTDSLLTGTLPTELEKWMQWDKGLKETSKGEVFFHYTQLGPLKEELSQHPPPGFDFSDKKKMISLSREYDTDIISLFHVTGDFNNRSRWKKGIKRVEEINHFLPRIGMKCKVVKDNGEEIIYSSSYHYHPARIEFSETEERTNHSVYYILEKINESKTKLTLQYFIQKNMAAEWKFSLLQKNTIEANFKKSMQNLETIVNE